MNAAKMQMELPKMDHNEYLMSRVIGGVGGFFENGEYLTEGFLVMIFHKNWTVTSN